MTDQRPFPKHNLQPTQADLKCMASAPGNPEAVRVGAPSFSETQRDQGESVKVGDKPSRRDDLTLEELDGEAILYDPRYGALHRFNAATLFVWDLCDGSRTLADIAHRMTQLCDVEPDEALDSVERVIAELRTLELLQGAPVAAMNKRNVPCWTKAPPEPEAPSVLPRVGTSEELRLSRRQLLRGGVTKLVFVAPVISTFFAAGAYASGPSASAAFGTDAGGDCKNIGYSCTIKDDCCTVVGEAQDCDANVCCVDVTGPCSTNGDCCSNSCTASVCD